MSCSSHGGFVLPSIVQVWCSQTSKSTPLGENPQAVREATKNQFWHECRGYRSDGEDTQLLHESVSFLDSTVSAPTRRSDLGTMLYYIAAKLRLLTSNSTITATLAPALQ
jgi:hypothetical protein